MTIKSSSKSGRIAIPGKRKKPKKEAQPEPQPQPQEQSPSSTSEIYMVSKLASVFSGIKRYRGAYGGRNSLKSTQFATMLLVIASQKPIRVLCCREFQNSLSESVMAQLIGVCERYPALGAIFEWGKDYFRSRNGLEFIFRGLRHNYQAIKSLADIDICWIEEAEDVSQDSLDALLPTIRKPGSEIWATWNPKVDGSPIDKLYRKSELPNMAVVEMNWRDNPWMTQDMHDLRLHDMALDPERYAHIWEGAYLTRSDAQVFKNWDIREFTMPPGTLPRFGIDWGFANDPTVAVRCYTIGREVYIDHEVVGLHTPIDQLPDLLDQVPGIREFYARADSSRPETIDYVKRRGFPKLMPAVKGAGSIEEGIEFLKGHRIIVHPRCKTVIQELTTYSYEVDRQTGQVLPKFADKYNHTIDAIRYAFEADRKSPQKNVSIMQKRINAVAQTQYDRFGR